MPIMQQTLPKPTPAVKLKLETIPAELKKLPRWILWRYTLKKTGKWTKTPHSANGGHKIDATNFDNGSSFTDAVQALRKNKSRFDGLGFLLGDGIAGIDVDDCIDDNGNLTDRGAAMASQYANTYAEVSPSGQGFKILVNIGDDPKLAVIGKNTKELEIYGGRRYFTVTGQLMPGHAATIAPMAEAFANTAVQLGINAATRTSGTPPTEFAAIEGVAPLPLEKRKGALGIDLKAARELLDHLPFSWCTDYGDWLRGGMALHHEFNGDTEALDLWDEYSQRAGHPIYEEGMCAQKWAGFGKPGKDFVTMRTVVRDAQAGGWRAPKTIESAIRDFTAFDEPSPPEVDEDGVLSKPPTWWHKYSVGNMLRTPAPARHWIWEGVLLRGKLMVVAGAGGSSKSFLMLSAAFQYALGNDWGPFALADTTTPGRTLLIYGEEDKDDVHGRIQTLQHSFMLTEEQIGLVEDRIAVLPLRGEQIEFASLDPATAAVVATEQLTKLEARIKQYDVQLVVLDPLALFHNLDENSNVLIASLVHEFDAMCMRLNCAMVIVHHFGKGGALTAREVNESNVRGASSLVAHVRTVAVMHRLRRDEATQWGVEEDSHAKWVMWTIAKNNYGPHGRMHWFEIDSTNGSIKPSPTQLEYLNTRDIREMARQHENEVTDAAVSSTAERIRSDAAQRDIENLAMQRSLLRYGADNGGTLPTLAKTAEALHSLGFTECSGHRARQVRTDLANRGCIHADGVITGIGTKWLENQEYLAGI